MRNKLFLNVLFLVAALGLAYYASLPGKNETDTQDWITIDGAGLNGVQYVSADRTIDAKPLAQAESDGWWVQYKKVTKPAAAVEKETLAKPAGSTTPPVSGSPAATPTPAASPTPPVASAETVEVGFKADASFKELLKAFAPLSAIRVLGDSDKLDLKEFGLVDSPDKIVFTTKDGKSIEFLVGKKSYGSANPFLLDPARKKVILVRGAYIENLKNAMDRMQERSIVNLRFDELKKVTVQRSGNKWVWDHTKKDVKGNLGWREDKEGAEIKPSYATWLDKISRLRVVRYIKETEKSELANSQPLLALEYSDGNKPIETLTVYKGPDVDNGPQYWVKTGFLSAYVDVGSPKVATLLKEVDELVAK